MKPLVFIDSFINEPVNHCVNDFVERNSYPVTYHQPSRYGLSSLESLIKEPAGIVLLGSASHITENCKWHKELLKWLIPYIEIGVPVLGICFGHQLLAHYYGAKVGYVDQRKTQFNQGRKLIFKNDFLGINAGEEVIIPYAHEQIVSTLPKNFEVIAHTEELAFEVLKHQEKPIFLMQGHPESSLKFIQEKISSSTPEKIKANGDRIMDGFMALCQK